MANTPKQQDPNKAGAATAKEPKAIAKLRHMAWEWQEIGHVAFFLLGALVAVFLSRVFGENAGQTPWSFFADLAQLSAATSTAALLTWLVKRALLGDLSDGEIRSLYHQLRKGTPDESRQALRAILADNAGSVACFALVLATWSLLY
jgi:hypothetical protein